MTNSPESLVRIQSPSMPTCAIAAKISGSFAAIQQEARRGGDRDPVAGALVDLLCSFRADELGGLLAGARVDVRTGPDLPSSCIVENHALAHARRTHRGDSIRPDLRLLERFLDAGPDQLPVLRRVEDLRTGNARCLSMRVLPLADRELMTVGGEDDCPAAARARVDGEQERVSHASTPAALATCSSGSPAANRRISLGHHARHRAEASRAWHRRCAAS